MPELLREILRGDFLLQHALLATLVLGATAPVAGGFLLLRKSVFLCVMLPQVSATGLAAGLLAANYFRLDGIVSGTPGGALPLICSLAAPLLALLLLAWLDRRDGTGGAEARHGALFALAGASTILAVSFDPLTGHEVAALLRGEIVSIGRTDFWLAAAGLLLPGGLLAAFHRQFLLIIFDPGFATANGMRVPLWNGALLVLVGAVTGAAVFVGGPLVCFGAMLLPAMAARRLTRSARRLFPLASALGTLGAGAGFLGAYCWDLPTGAALVAADGIILAASHLATLRHRRGTAEPRRRARKED